MTYFTVNAQSNAMMSHLGFGLVKFIYLLLRRVPTVDISLHHSALIAETQASVIAYTLFPP